MSQESNIFNEQHNAIFNALMKDIGQLLLIVLKDKDTISASIEEHINTIEQYFRKYDSVQLLGAIGLYLLDNIPNIEKRFYEQINGKKMVLDENAEALAEYALNFALALPNDGKENPTDQIIEDLKYRLKALLYTYLYLDMPLESNSLKAIEWLIHMDTIVVRGDGYQKHIYEVFKEMFIPHSHFYQNEFGYSIEQLLEFFMDLENRVFCKIADQNNIYGAMKLYERWTRWEEQHYGPMNDMSALHNRDFTKGKFGEFFDANPDVPHTDDRMQFLMYQPNDYSNSNMIFWVYPQNNFEEKILDSLSMKYGENSLFLKDGEFKGNIMNGHSIFEKPFVKDGDKYYCFTPMIPHRNLFLIAEKLMMRNDAYYQRNFQQNTSLISRDVYVENKIKTILESFLTNVNFYSSVHYSFKDNDLTKNPELDILGVSEKAIYIIEVKAHELSYKDRVGLKGAKDKFKASVLEACRQCFRATKYICDTDQPQFNTKQGTIMIDKSKPIYKIAITFQQYSSLIGQMDKLVESELMEDQYRDTWIVSLFDLMVVSDTLKSEDDFLSYLDVHRTINTNHSTYYDELDILGQFLYQDLASKIDENRPTMIVGGSEDIDARYSYFPLDIKGL